MGSEFEKVVENTFFVDLDPEFHKRRCYLSEERRVDIMKTVLEIRGKHHEGFATKPLREYTEKRVAGFMNAYNRVTPSMQNNLSDEAAYLLSSFFMFSKKVNNDPNAPFPRMDNTTGLSYSLVQAWNAMGECDEFKNTLVGKQIAADAAGLALPAVQRVVDERKKIEQSRKTFLGRIYNFWA